jgi:sulfite reductase beta subunit
MAFISSGYNPDKPMENRITDIGPQKYDNFIRRSSPRTRANGCITKSQTRCAGARGRKRRRVYTVRVGGARLMSVTHIREICEIADKHCDGHLRFTTRNNIEFMVDSKDKVEPLVKDLESRKFDGGSFKFPSAAPAPASPTSFTPRAGSTATPRPPMLPVRSRPPWTSCSTTSEPPPAGPAARLSGLLPEHVRRRALLRYRHPRLPPQTADAGPRISGQMCEIPLAIAACPTAAIKPAKVEIGGKKSTAWPSNNDRCMFCGNCYTMCPSMPLADKEGDGIV